MGVKVRQIDGAWYVKTDWRGKRKAKKFGSERAAQVFAAELEKLLAVADLYADADDISIEAAVRRALRESHQEPERQVPTVSDYAKTWKAHNAGRDGWKKSTRQNYESIFDTHVEPWWGDVRLDEIGRRGVREWVAHLRRSKLERTEAPPSPKTLKNVYRVLSSIISSAVDDEILEGNPILRMGRVMPKVAKDRRPVRAWDRDQVRRILAAARDKSPRYWPLFVFLEETGVRIGEACGLQWIDLDLQQGQALIQRARVRGEATSTKGRGYRAVPMTEDLCNLLRAQRTRLAREALAKERPQPTHVFTSTRGTPVDADNLRARHWKRIVRAAEVPDYGFHGFRHTRASWWLMAGVDPMTVSRRLGHGDISTTVDTYGHVLEATIDDDGKPLWRQEEWVG